MTLRSGFLAASAALLASSVSAGCAGDEGGLPGLTLALDGQPIRFELAKVDGSVNRDRVFVAFSEADDHVQSVVVLEMPCSAPAGAHPIDDDEYIVKVTAAESINNSVDLGTGTGDSAARTQSFSGEITVERMACRCAERITGFLDAELHGFKRGDPSGTMHTIQVRGPFEADTSAFTYDGNCKCPCPGR